MREHCKPACQDTHALLGVGHVRDGLASDANILVPLRDQRAIVAQYDGR